ncbi:MAG: GMC family oxidoreductase N-terminal domain-containing protein [Acidimicrobiia bacterium]|jgi:choline dehydrogenase
MLSHVVTDYVIVGAGSAGCVLAEALSTHSSVTLLEAGGSDRGLEVAVPAAFSKLFKSVLDWDLSTEPEPGADERSLYLPRGRMLGGSSSMNAMLYIRGRPSDYDGWVESGAMGWGWESVLETFKTMESNSRGANEFHGDSGPVRVEEIRFPNPLSRRFVEAALELGISANSDFNGAGQEGAGLFQVTQKRGRRWSAADAFLKPALGRPTLEVIRDAHATRVLFAGSRAVGVEFSREGKLERVEAEKEVILAAGAYGSPHLLQVSGIGDPDHLAEIGVDVVTANREVGANLQDHPVSGLMYDSIRPGTLDDAENTFSKLRWILFRSGRLTSPVAEACIFIKSSDAVEEPDLQFHFGPASFDDHGMAPYDGHAFTFGPVLVNPRSRGWVRARSADPLRPPAIQTNCLTDPDDVSALVNGMYLGREIAAQPPLDEYRGVEVYPGSDVTSHKEMVDFVKSRVELFYHPAGTCRMGSDDDAVVDSRLRVNGVERLRVVDASIMPTVVSGNTNAPTMMIAARGAAMIREDGPG